MGVSANRPPKNLTTDVIYVCLYALLEHFWYTACTSFKSKSFWNSRFFFMHDLNDAHLNTPEGNLLANSVAQEMRHMPKFSKEDL